MGTPRRRAFTLLELLVVIAILTVLMSVLLPALSKARELGRRTVCLSNIHSIGTASLAYQNDFAFPPFYYNAIVLGQDYSYSWSDFLVKYNYLKTDVNPSGIPTSDGTGGTASPYLTGMVSQRAKIFQCPTQDQRVWTDLAGVPVSYRADYLATGHDKAQPVPAAGIYKSRAHHQDAALIWLTEAFTPAGGISATEYLRETQLHIDAAEANPLRHAGGSTYLFGDTHAQWSDAYHTLDWQSRLGLPWEADE